jgi:8-oxo-dGTP diphosphatase
VALNRLRGKLEYTTVGFELLPKKFTLSDLQQMYEAILNKSLDKRNFRRKVQALGILRPLKEWQKTGRKPARLYSFAPQS